MPASPKQIVNFQFKNPSNLENLDYCEFENALTRAYFYLSGYKTSFSPESEFSFFQKKTNAKQTSENLISAETTPPKKISASLFINAIPCVMEILTACLKSKHINPTQLKEHSISYFILRSRYSFYLLREECDFLTALYDSRFEHNHHLVKVITLICLKNKIIKKRSKEAQYIWVYDDICEKHNKEISALLKSKRDNRHNNFNAIDSRTIQSINMHSNIIASTAALSIESDAKAIADASTDFVRLKNTI